MKYSGQWLIVGRKVDPRSPGRKICLLLDTPTNPQPTVQPSLWSNLNPWQHNGNKVVIWKEQGPDHTAISNMLDDSWMTEVIFDH